MADAITTAAEGSPAGAEPAVPDRWWRRWAQRVVGAPRSRDELLAQITAARSNGLIDVDAADMVRGVFETSELQVRDIMIPRAQMVAMEHDWDTERVRREATESGHSRFPVTGESRDEVLGILLAKDLIGVSGTQASAIGGFPFQRLLRPAVFVPESKRVNVLLRDFKRDRQHMAIVADEYGGVAGLVTIEDVLETIVGDIDDEYDDEEAAQILRLDDRRYSVNGLTPIEDFNEYFHTDFPDDDFDTVAGLVMHTLGHMPRRGESLRIQRFQFIVQRADQRHVQQLQVTLSQP
ncbi:MAG TPA: transporter associated domain-containing protein [Nevskiaceae bacterium]|nr:transporter associated domain-containing protein [Nevskiaceae bacterium]